MDELTFEKALINHLEEVQGTQRWKYREDIKTTEDLWNNFAKILYQNNQAKLDNPLSPTEFAQVKDEICALNTPFKAGQFLYGFNGVSQLYIKLDNGKDAYLTVFNQKQIGAGDTVYEVVNQIQRPAVLAGKKDRRFDVTLLINGLPIIQIEEKAATENVNDALNQMHQYINENQYKDIFSTVQILIAMTENDIKYMANTTPEAFNKNFAFRWQNHKTNKEIRDWKEFTSSMLSIPMAHNMATNYMILDGTKNKSSIKVMRPYQVFATERVLNGIKEIDFDFGNRKIGYIWHTTGSGKTITSFKTAWLASKNPKVDKVVFVVDRVALINQTLENYRAYDPDCDLDDISSAGSVNDTESTKHLKEQLESKSGGIIITSFQKLDKLVKRPSFNSPNKNIVFIVDEAHRSTNGESFSDIQKAFKRSAWVGYTGTPRFDVSTSGTTTEDVFGKQLHCYTIKEAISDRNVLGFNVDFQTTIDEEKLKKEFLPQSLKEKNPKWDQERIDYEILTNAEALISEEFGRTVYDLNDNHVKLVVADIFRNWENRSVNGLYNALLTTRLGGTGTSAPMVLKYFEEFERVNNERIKDGKQALKVAATFSLNSSNDDNMVKNNEGLEYCIKQYNQTFGTNFGLDSVPEYTADLSSRLNKTCFDKNYLDLVIVIDQLLTGFDAPELNTLYVDRILNDASLVQAYSRTNRIHKMDTKPFGNIVNYRWPSLNENLMNKALAIYSNSDLANKSNRDIEQENVDAEIVALKFWNKLAMVKQTVSRLRELTDNFTTLPASRKEKEEMYNLLKEYNKGVSALKQHDLSKEEDYSINVDNEAFIIKHLGMTKEQAQMLSVSLANQLKEELAKAKNISFEELDLVMLHVKNMIIDFDYLKELLEKLTMYVKEDNNERAKEISLEIESFANGMENRTLGRQIKKSVKWILTGMFKHEANLEKIVDVQEWIANINKVSNINIIDDFRHKWGIPDSISNEYIVEMFAEHVYKMDDLNSTHENKIIKLVRPTFKELSNNDEIKSLKPLKYGNLLREALRELADDLCD